MLQLLRSRSVKLVLVTCPGVVGLTPRRTRLLSSLSGEKIYIRTKNCVFCNLKKFRTKKRPLLLKKNAQLYGTTKKLIIIDEKKTYHSNLELLKKSTQHRRQKKKRCSSGIQVDRKKIRVSNRVGPTAATMATLTSSQNRETGKKRGGKRT